ncbi:hypothetical protein Y032_0109g107 [Ancylostoma ceylanicum]|uniref:Uncharacterized protein n=1 Tax=Ancylostoma ceylanicum TaxID=53326 RepID=A0A016TEV1_9BILA|nr:hypothetical protein Y032_0109g107 [Ancylostoma ceylanicum]
MFCAGPGEWRSRTLVKIPRQHDDRKGWFFTYSLCILCPTICLSYGNAFQGSALFVRFIVRLLLLPMTWYRLRVVQNSSDSIFGQILSPALSGADSL